MTEIKEQRLRRKANRLMAELAKTRKQLRPPRPAAQSNNPRGRPPVDEDKLFLAKELVKKGAVITSVAMKVGIGVSTLYDHGISRAAVEREKELAAAT